MNNKRKIVYLVMIALTLLCMILPIAQFRDDSVRAVDMKIVEKEAGVDTVIASDNGKYTRANKKVVEAEGKYAALFPAFEADASIPLKDQMETALSAMEANADAFEADGTLAGKDLEERREYIAELRKWQATLDMYNEKDGYREVTDTRYTQMLVLLDRQLKLDAMQAEITAAGDAADATKVAALKDVGKLQNKLLDTISEVNKKQKVVDDLFVERAEVEAAPKMETIHYSLLPGTIPAATEIDYSVINTQTKTDENGEKQPVYPTTFTDYYVAIWVAAAMLVLAIVLVLLGGNRLVSKLYTFASFANLIAVLCLLFVIIRLNAYPVKLPWSNPVINWPMAIALVLMPFFALMVHCSAVTNTKRTMIYVLCIALSVLSILPFWMMIVNATRNSQQIQGGVSLLPSTFLMNNWHILQAKNFDVMVGFKNSAIIAFGSTILGVYFSALTAYGFVVYKFKGNKFLYSVIMAIIMIPGQVTGTGFFMFMYQLGWTNNYLPLIIPAIASASTVFFFRQYLEANFQVSLVEAARIDGAGEFYTYNRIVMPLMIPAMATMAIMAVIGSWNNYLTPLMLLREANMKTLPMMVKELRGDIYRTEYGSIYLGLTLTALPLIVVYFAFSKYIIAGVAVGGVKE